MFKKWKKISFSLLSEITLTSSLAITTLATNSKFSNVIPTFKTKNEKSIETNYWNITLDQFTLPKLFSKQKNFKLNNSLFLNSNPNRNLNIIYRSIYNNAMKNGAISPSIVANNYQNLPNRLKDIVNSIGTRIFSLKKSTINQTNLFVKEWEILDLNLYFPPNLVIGYVDYLNNVIIPALNYTNNVGSNLQTFGEILDGTGEDSDIAAAILDLFGAVLQIVSGLGMQITTSILKTFNSAYEQNQGATIHLLFGFIYIGSSIGNVEWWD